jgi:deazaflavin-dependent oxidoreductase (nitroreductase family)
MPLPRTVARFNRAVWNKASGQFTPYIPGFATIQHRGRKSGKLYQTPVNVFKRPDGRYAVALVYGRDADWAKNVLAAGECVLETRTRMLGMVDPEIIHDANHEWLPLPVRQAFKLLKVNDFLVMTRA